MSFQTVSRFSLEILNQHYRAPGVAPRSVPPGRGDGNAPQDPDYKVADEFIRVMAFINADINGRPLARQYQVRTVQDIFEPPFTARSGGTAWTTGTTTSFGQELEIVGARFKKISTVVRLDELMVTDLDDDMLKTQVRLAQIGTIRSVSEALLHSSPSNDDNAELAGLPYYLPANSPQDILYDPARKMIGGMAEIEARCCPSDGDFGGRPDVFVMSSRSRWRLLKELEDKGVTPDFHYCSLTRMEQFHFHGIPVLTGRAPEPSSSGAPTTEAWALKLYGPSGVRVLHIGGNPDEFGVRTEPMTTMTTTDGSGEVRTATRGVEVFGVYSVLVPEPTSVARLRGIPARDPFTQP